MLNEQEQERIAQLRATGNLSAADKVELASLEEKVNIDEISNEVKLDKKPKNAKKAR